MTSERNTGGGKGMGSIINRELTTKGKKSQCENQPGKFDRKSIAAIERVRAPQLDTKIDGKTNNISDSYRGGDSDYVYSPSSDTGK